MNTTRKKHPRPTKLCGCQDPPKPGAGQFKFKGFGSDEAYNVISLSNKTIRVTSLISLKKSHVLPICLIKVKIILAQYVSQLLSDNP